MPKKKQNFPDLGHTFGRPDIERIGLFSEMPYITAQQKKTKKKQIQKEPRNLYCEGPKTKNGTQHGYFEPEFKRIFSKEALRGRGRKPPPQRFKNVADRPFLPPIGFKIHSCPGDYYGTFSGVIEALGNKTKPKPPHKSVGRNLFSSPGKMGGPGYADITISPYPEHQPDRYGLKPKYKEFGKNLGRAIVPVHFPQPFFDKNPFREAENFKPGPTYVRPKERPVKSIHPGYIVPNGPGKTQGGCHDGCFNKFPEHQSDRVKTKVKKVTEGVFAPPASADKNYYNTSILNQTVDLRINSLNYLDYAPTYNKYLVTN